MSEKLKRLYGGEIHISRYGGSSNPVEDGTGPGIRQVCKELEELYILAGIDIPEEGISIDGWPQPFLFLISAKSDSANPHEFSVVGMATLNGQRKNGGLLIGEVTDVFVREEMRGKGVGIELLRHVVATASWCGMASLRASVNPHREGGVEHNAFFANRGFQKISEATDNKRRGTNLWRFDIARNAVAQGLARELSSMRVSRSEG